MLTVEILSPSTRREDIIRKRDCYYAIPSLRWRLYAEPKNVQVDLVMREANDSWRALFAIGLSAITLLDSLSVNPKAADFHAKLAATK